MSEPASARALTELRVTANVMTLEAGTYCAFVAAGSPGQEPSTGLPAVRLSAAPGALAGRVSLAGFGGDWLTGRDGALLVRVSGGPAPVLVTVYQAAGATGEAPRVQILRLSEAAAPSPGPAEPIEAMAHVYGIGDVGGRLGDWIGERGSQRWIEGFALRPADLGMTLEYQAVLGRGWLSPWVEAGEFCGSRGLSLPILGLHVRLRGEAAGAFRASVSATFVDGTATGPVSGRPAEAESLAALEAFRVTLEELDPS